MPRWAGFLVTWKGEILPKVEGELHDKNGLYSEMETARQWGLTPGQWYDCDRAERAVMIAQSIIRSRIESAAMNHGDK